MTVDDLPKFIKKAPPQIFINHLEVLHYCPTTRKDLQQLVEPQQLFNKVFMPEDRVHFIL